MNAGGDKRLLLPSGRISRLGYFVLFVFPAVIVLLAAEYADQMNCLNAPLLKAKKNPSDLTEVEEKIPSAVVSVIQEKMRENCKNAWFLQIQKKNASEYSVNLQLGFEMSKNNGYVSGTPFQTLALLLLIWPSIVMTVKRFHDVGKPAKILLYPLGASLFFTLMPFLNNPPSLLLVGLLIFLATFLISSMVALLVKGQEGGNCFGPDPLGTN